MPGLVLGGSPRRREDARLLTGGAAFVDDEPPAGGLFAAFARSPVAHAHLHRVDLGPALACPDVVGAYAAADLGLPARLSYAVVDGVFARPPLATDRVRFVGEAMAVVVGRTRAAAADGALAVEADFEALPVVVGSASAAAPGSPPLFPERGEAGNLVLEVGFGDGADVLDGAEVVVRARFLNQRLTAVPIEPNAVLAAPDPATGGVRVWASTQSPFQVRDFIADCLGLPENRVRCTAPDVGGAFGAKLMVYPEQAVVAALALRHRAPVRWIETRSESFLAMTQGRDQVQEVELGATRAGRLTGLRVRVLADTGAYPSQGTFLPYYTGQMLSGVYAIPRIAYGAASYATNTTPTAAYRGAGRPEAAALLERSIDMLARELGQDPAELRRRNLIPAARFPYTTATGAQYDSGNYEAALDRVLQLGAYRELRAEQRRRLEAGGHQLLGIGLSLYVEVTAIPSPTEFASAELDAGGGFTVRAGTAAHGQGHQTAYAQIAAATLGVAMERIQVIEGDTALVPRGDGTSGSRSIQLAGSAILLASRELLEQARRRVAERLEADLADVVADAERGLGVRGVPGSSLTWAEIAAAGPEPLRAEVDFVASDSTYPFGAHLAVVEVDAETGEARLLRHLAVDDCGTQVNPALVAGQVHGGVAQGVAQALFEEVVHDAAGNPLTASLLDYGVPSAAELPLIESFHTETPTPLNPLGAKGIGESGTIGATPAVQNAVLDALAHLGVRHLDMPLSPERIWRAVRASGGHPA